jgi:hypothetical protein
MGKINVRSPYFITDNSVTVFPGGSSPLASATLYIRIYTGNASISLGQTPNYTISSTAIDGSVTFEVSELARDYIENTFNGDYTSSVKWFNYNIIRTYENTSINVTPQQNLAILDGYGYFEEGANPQNDSVVLQSNDLIYTNDFSNITIPVHVKDNTTVTYLKNGEPVFTKTLVYSTNSADQIQYVSNSSLDYDVFYNRVIDDGGEIEAFNCVKEIADSVYQDFDADEVYIDNGESVEVIKVSEIEECKYTPYKLTFVNKYGALQDVWFFKRSTLSMGTTQETYKSNIVTDGSYSINNHQKRILNKQGNESLTLNSGFYAEEYNEVFKQLLLSEQVWINYETNALPVNITSSALTFKDQLNDKLISYEINVEFSNDIINNIR